MARKGTYTSTFTFDGKRFFTYGKTQDEADAKAIEKQTLLKVGHIEPRSSVTVAEWAEKWLADYKKGAVSQAWFDNMEGIMRNHILPQIGSKRLKDVTASDIQRMMNHCAHFSESHQRKISQITAQIFDSAVDNDLIVKVPTKKIKVAVRSDKTSSRTITEEERDLTMRVAEKHPDVALPFLIMLYCGLRPQEIARLQMQDYDKDGRVLYVHRARKADGSTAAPKSKSGNRLIPVPECLAKILDSLEKKPDEYICLSATGKPLTKSSQKLVWRKMKRLMDIENGAVVFRNAIVESTLADDLRPYCYRHTYCTDLQDAEVPVTVAQRFMGHSDIKMTAQIYTHHSQKSFEDARDKINRLHKVDK